MKIAIYGKFLKNPIPIEIRQMFARLDDENVDVYLHKKFYSCLQKIIHFRKPPTVFDTPMDIKEPVDYFFSIGGDGTFLDTATYVANSKTPILGINTGRLGFLTGTAIGDIPDAVDNLFNKRYNLEERSVIMAEDDAGVFCKTEFALNEISILNRHDSTMITIHTWIDDIFLASYWADGLIISTPTGSTAYSMSCGGPIMAPDSKAFIITPVAPHNLNMRPVVIPDTSILKIKVEGRAKNFLVNLDSKNKIIANGTEFIVKKAAFQISSIKFPEQDFFSTIRNKLLWGIDSRN